MADTVTTYRAIHAAADRLGIRPSVVDYANCFIVTWRSTHGEKVAAQIAPDAKEPDIEQALAQLHKVSPEHQPSPETMAKLSARDAWAEKLDDAAGFSSLPAGIGISRSPLDFWNSGEEKAELTTESDPAQKLKAKANLAVTEFILERKKCGGILLPDVCMVEQVFHEVMVESGLKSPPPKPREYKATSGGLLVPSGTTSAAVIRAYQEGRKAK